MRRVLACTILLAAATLRADDALQFGGFTLLRGAYAPDSGQLQSDAVSAQVQLGIDWKPTPRLTAHLHLLGRTETDDRTRRGNAGVVEAYVESSFHPHGDRLRLRGGAMFLPTSRENVDALWESPYTITSSALNSWMGEELRPIGIDAAWFHRGAMVGATIFRGNDTLGSLPVVRGWTLDDHWALLGEWIPVDPEYFTSVSAENDHRLGWSARAGWTGAHFSAQFTHLDNRSDGLDYGPLFNWGTRFDVAALEYTTSDWTIAAESGWGPSFLVVEGETFVTNLYASYLLASRRFAHGRGTVRVERFTGGPGSANALTLAWLWTPPGHLRPGFEITRAGGDTRGIVELRYGF